MWYFNTFFEQCGILVLFLNRVVSVVFHFIIFIQFMLIFLLLKHDFSLEGYLRTVYSMEGVNIELENDEIVIIQDMNFTMQLIYLLDKFSPR